MTPKRPPTIIDVAREAGVSTATVSRVLNGGPVTDETRHAVQRVIERLGYRRNSLARGLVTGRTGVIGVLIPDIGGPLYADMVRGVEDVTRPLGMHAMLVTDNRDPEREADAIELLLTHRIDALIDIGSTLGADDLAALVGDLPLVLVQHERPGTGFATVAIDNRAGVALAVEHLTERGHRAIAHIAGVRRDGEERAAAFGEQASAHDLDPAPVFAGHSVEQSGREAAAWLADHPAVSAVVCTNDRTAFGLYQGLKARGVGIPETLSVTGFDDLPWGAFLDPPLTTVRQPGREMGRQAALRVLASPPPEAGSLTIAPTLIERASVARAPPDARR